MHLHIYLNIFRHLSIHRSIDRNAGGFMERAVNSSVLMLYAGGWEEVGEGC